MLSSVSKDSSLPAQGCWSIGQVLLAGAEGRANFPQ